MRISDWSSDVCSSDLDRHAAAAVGEAHQYLVAVALLHVAVQGERAEAVVGERADQFGDVAARVAEHHARFGLVAHQQRGDHRRPANRSEEHTSELQSLMRISYAVFCLKKKKQ